MTGSVHGKFDLSDVGVECPPIDKLDALLDAVAEVLDENAPDPGRTRVERMARWLALNVGGAPYAPAYTSGAISKFQLADGFEVWRVGEHVVVEHDDHGLNITSQARAIAVAILRAVELAEGVG